MKGINRTLFKIAVITSPLIGLYSILPIWFLVDSIPLEVEAFETFKTGRILLGVLAISTNIFIMWCVNILIYHQLHQRQLRTQKSYEGIRYVISYSLALGFIIILSLSTAENRPFFQTGLLKYYPIVGSVANNSLILLLMNIFINQKEKSVLQLQKAELEINQLVMQHEQLKQQIHPHSLFNALASLQILISKDIEKAKKYASDLADYLRKSIELSRRDTVKLREDLDFCKQYVALQQIRFSGEIFLKTDIGNNALDFYQLPVSTLHILAENAIKHNAFSKTKPLVIHLKVEGSELTFTNNILPKYNVEDSTGVGLQNLKKRFQLFGVSPPIIVKEKSDFSVQLKLLEI